MGRVTAALAMVLLVLLAGCADPEEECEENGGEWLGKLAGADEGRCALPTGDAGKLCTDSGECEGACLAVNYDPDTATAADEGRCAAVTASNGCPPVLVDGVVNNGCP